MKKETINKLCASYMEDARGLKRNTPNRNFVLRLIEDTYKAGLEDAYKSIKPLSWTVGKYEMLANTFVGIFSVCPKCGKKADKNYRALSTKYPNEMTV